MTEKSNWTGDYWGPGGTVARARQVFASNSYNSVRDTVSFASTLYSAAGAALAKFKSSLNPFWIPQGISLLFESYFLVRSVPLMAIENPDQADVISTILMRLPWERPSALAVCAYGQDLLRIERNDILQGMDGFIPEHSGAKPHTLGLLKTTEALLVRRSEPSRAAGLIVRALQLANDAERDGELAQAARIHKRVAQYHRREGNSKKAEAEMRRAERLAHASGATDQLLKMGVSQN